MVSYDQILQWQRGTMAEQIAADLTSRISKGSLSKWDSLPLNRTLAKELNVSERTISKAKRILHGHGVLTLDCRRYYIA
jgi:DNA-binding GntR family transcriptional regulator